MLIEQLIGDLLLRHNCVVVPAFGGFVARQTSASLDPVNGVMLPPRKSLLFNKQLINNDGLLIASLAKESGISYNEAAAEIQAQVESWQKLLNSGERITLDRVGYLFLDQEKNIGFEQDRYFNLLLQSYGLGKVHFISEEDIQIISQPEIQIKPEPVYEAPLIELIPEGASIVEVNESETEAPVIQLREKKPVKLWRYVAAAALIPIAFYSYWIPMKTKVLESGVFAIQDFNPFHAENTGAYQRKDFTVKLDTSRVTGISVEKEIAALSPGVSVWSYPFGEDLYMPVKIDQAQTQQQVVAVETPTVEMSVETKPEKPAQPVKAASSQTGNMHLVANCFGSEANANKFVSYLKSKGFDAYIIDVNKGLHRVSAGRSSSAAALADLQEKLDGLNIEGSWILKN